MHYFVTGGTGLVGKHLLVFLNHKKIKTTALYRKHIPNELLHLEYIHWIKGDLGDIVFLEDVLKNVTHIIHLAGVVSFFKKDKYNLFNVNVNYTKYLVDAALLYKHIRFVHISSTSVFDAKEKNSLITEKDYIDLSKKNSNYSKTKYLGEMEVWRGIEEGLNAVILNPSVILACDKNFISSTAFFKPIVKHNTALCVNKQTGWVDIADVITAIDIVCNSDVKTNFIINAINDSQEKIMAIFVFYFKPNITLKKLSFKQLKTLYFLDSIASFLHLKKPTLSQELMQSLQHHCAYDNKKFLEYFPHFKYAHLEDSVKRIVGEYKN